ncbi:MAG: hypothetical protein KME31_06010 [Tolypothrix carrinoi HA7290-LM1]|nr:hypothetical protein [Tolypothrix carrinoi HA7290-LM1]
MGIGHWALGIGKKEEIFLPLPPCPPAPLPHAPCPITHAPLPMPHYPLPLTFNTLDS